MTSVENPILSGFYPDPSICRVDKDFYLVNSSFSYFPGVPIFHSRDLAHWEQIGNILEREEQCPLEGNEISRGIFAPTIRYNNGIFYMITTNVSDDGNFIVTAEKPEGPWSDPNYLGAKAEGIDPSLFFDDDGKCYYIGTRQNPDGVRYNGDWEIWIQELDISTMKLVGNSMAIWKGAVKDVIWPEGPHMYKINGFYYLLIAEGGTGPDHAISIARSKELFKWFEGSPRNPIFTHRNLGNEYPVVNVGHGDLIDDPSGNWYIVLLATRRCKKHSSLGRETYLAKVIWEDGWPVVNPGIGKLEKRVELPIEEHRFIEEVAKNDHFIFKDQTLDNRLLGILNRSKKIYSLTERDGYLRLFSRKETISNKENASYLGVRQKSYNFEVNTGLLFEPHNKETAGLVLYQNHSNNLRMEVVKSGQKRMFRITAHIDDQDTIVAEYEQNSPYVDILEIRFRATQQIAKIWIKDTNDFHLVANEIDLLPYTSERAGGFVGCTIGMYTSANGNESSNHADFAWFFYDSIE